jgi:hypothetical protein
VVDLFEEVEEQLRSDRYMTLLRRWVPWLTAILAAVLIGYLGYWGFKLYEDRNQKAAATAYQAGVDALGQSDTKSAFAHFETAAKTGAPAYKVLALIQQGDLRAAAGKAEAAAALYDAAAQAAPNPIFADLGSLKAAEVLLDTAPYPQLQARLLPLTDSKRPFSAYAREALAMAKLLAGKTAAARQDLSRLTLTLDVPVDMRQRAQTAIQLIDSGEVASAVAAVKVAATLPPPPPGSVASESPDAPDPGGPPSPPAGAAQ